ncbi:DUF3426 domain-containing protein [Diaphorobacter sp. HDW4A]|uniref:DUF3426 domain-containing protein n=1 Tax=Diaphorobacter sp. HDW4A TaxID=2714924 RepID=UPI0035300471
MFDASANLLGDVRYAPVPQAKGGSAAEVAATTPAASSPSPMAPVPQDSQVSQVSPTPPAASVAALAKEDIPPPAPAASAAPTVVVPPTPAASFAQNVPVKEDRPNVWSNARASVTGFSNASIQHLAQESVEGRADSSPVAPPAPVARPWAGHFSPAPTPPQVHYGSRLEANVVPPGWKPESAGRKPAAADEPSDDSESRVEPAFVSSRLQEEESKPEPVVESESQSEVTSPLIEVQTRSEPTLEMEKAAPDAPHPVIISQDPELLSQRGTDDEDDDGEEMPELTFEASRQHDLVDEPVIIAERHADEVAADKEDEAPAADAERMEPTLESTPDEVVQNADAEAEESGEQASTSRTSHQEDDVQAKPADQEPATAEQPKEEAEQEQAVAKLSEDEVGFMRDARRKAFWSKPAVRGLLLLVSLGLVAGFAGQYAVAERNRLAAMYPALRPVLEQLCQPLKCEVGLPRLISSVAIDSSTFTRVRDDATSFNLQVALKSTADMVLEMPALELTLTDSSDQPVLRRVLKREDTGAPAELAARGEWSGVVKLQVPEVADRVTGYRLLAFYP